MKEKTWKTVSYFSGGFVARLLHSNLLPCYKHCLLCVPVCSNTSLPFIMETETLKRSIVYLPSGRSYVSTWHHLLVKDTMFKIITVSQLYAMLPQCYKFSLPPKLKAHTDSSFCQVNPLSQSNILSMWVLPCSLSGSPIKSPMGGRVIASHFKWSPGLERSERTQVQLLMWR